MLKLDHKNIVKLFEFFQIKTKVYMVMEKLFSRLKIMFYVDFVFFKRFHLKILEGRELFDLICDTQEIDEDNFQFIIDIIIAKTY